MKVALGSDEKGPLIEAVLEVLKARGIEVKLFGPPAETDADLDWPLTSAHVAQAVAGGEVDRGIVCCWTGTGASIAANKVRGVRAALCGDAETAKGARIWNDANVLALSLRATSPALGKEIVNAWLDASPGTDDWNQRQLARVRELEAAFAASAGAGTDAQRS